MLMETNQNINLGLCVLEDETVNMMVDMYIEAMKTPLSLNEPNDNNMEEEEGEERVYYSPLGELEVSLICSAFNIHLFIVKSEIVELMMEFESQKNDQNEEEKNGGDGKAEKKELKSGEKNKRLDDFILNKLDPRSIKTENFHEQRPLDNPPKLRIVRLLNVRTNHYMVHLPSHPSTSS